MNQEENVYEETTLTEDTKTLEKDGGEHTAAQDASTVLGKFKSVDALAQAYSALQAEFTRRSQRLKALEKETENLKGDKLHREDVLGVEKLRKTAKAKRAENKRFDAFLADVVGEKASLKPVSDVEEGAALECAEKTTKEEVFLAKTTADEQTQETVNVDAVVNERVPMMEEGDKNDYEKASVEKNVSTVLEEAKGSVATSEPILSSEGLYEKVQKDEQVRLRIIGEYLASIGKSGAPVTCGNHGILAAPPLRAKSIADAGGMALHYFKNQTNIVK